MTTFTKHYFHAAAEEANRFGTRKTRVSREFPCKNVLV